jgi:hypothetical protein
MPGFYKMDFALNNIRSDQPSPTAYTLSIGIA